MILDSVLAWLRRPAAGKERAGPSPRKAAEREPPVPEALLDAEPWFVDRLQIDGHRVSAIGWSFATPGALAAGAAAFLVNGVAFERVRYPLPRPDVGAVFWQRRGAETSGFEAESAHVEPLYPDGVMTIARTRPETPALERGRDLLVFPDPERHRDLPDPARRIRVTGNDDPAAFLQSGATDCHRLDRACHAVTGRHLHEAGRVLDWGCGCGRIARHLPAAIAERLTGCDIDRDNVGWCSEHLPGRFVVSAPAPPLPFADASFDLVYGVSVFTHLREPLQTSWLAELARIAAPGAHLLLSVHGLTATRFSRRPPGEYEAFNARVERDGFVMTGTNRQIEGHTDRLGEYVNVHHSHDYLRRVWGRFFEVLAIIPGYVANQDLVVLRRRAGEAPALPGTARGERQSIWRELFVERAMERAESTFHVVPALSAISLGGARDLDGAYRDFLSPTTRIGFRVPILYLRTTRGAPHDWEFDPDWDIERVSGGRRVAEDSLGATLRHSVSHDLPLLLTLNGGVWSDAFGDAPEWDATDHLEQDPANCQWNERDEVMPDDWFARAAGTPGSPHIARMLTFNVFAACNRHYKRRNLQAAGRLVARFAREHPDLFLGITLDPDTYHCPFFDEAQWYDYNPGMLRQFRHWLAGSGPYAGDRADRGHTPPENVPDLTGWRRARPLTLEEVRTLSGRAFARWDDVDPPRRFPREGTPFWEDPWVREWMVFRRHTVALHYSELAEWLVGVGIPPSKIFSSQGFLHPNPSDMPFATHVDSPPKNYDGGGMSIEGAIPRQGHLGAILYGPGAVNDMRMESPGSAFATFRRMDPGWAVVEFNTADLRDPGRLPGYADGYRALSAMFNHGARFVSPMAWNGSQGEDAGKPGYAAVSALRATPLEGALLDFLVDHAWLPLGARLWTFGTARHADSDGWSLDAHDPEAGAIHAPDAAPHPAPTVESRCGSLVVRGHRVALLSPDGLGLRPEDTDLLVIGVGEPHALAAITVEARTSDGRSIALGASDRPGELPATAAGIGLPLAWPRELESVERLRIVLLPADPTSHLRIDRLALYPPSGKRGQSGNAACTTRTTSTPSSPRR